MLAQILIAGFARRLRRADARPYLIGGGIGAAIVALIVVAALCVPTTITAARLPVRDLTNGARSVHVDGFNLWYREVGPKDRRAGAGRPVIVVIHGGPGMSDHYFNNAFDFLSDTYRVVYYDQRGSGFSQIRPNPRFYRFSYLADDLEAPRKRVIRADKLILIGHSFGGLVAMSYAQKFPLHVAGLVFISSMAARDDTPQPKRRPDFDPWFAAQKPSVADAALLESYLGSVGETLYDPYSGIVPDVGYYSYVPARLLWYSAIGYDFSGALSRLHVPSLVISGARDTTLSESTPTELRSLLAGSRLVRFERSGHWAFLEEPARFKAVVGQFIRAAFP